MARALIRRVATAQAVILGAVGLTVGLIHLAPVGANPGPALGLSAPPKPKGYLRVVANPWAYVLIDGEQKAVTPFSEPIEVPAGRHRVVLKNDYFADITRELEIPEGTRESAVQLREDFEGHPR
jgi:serine/threonine-protein kinase